MSQMLCSGLHKNLQNAVTLTAESISQFTPDQWTRGIDEFQSPCKIAYHLIECLDYYFREQPDEPFSWGYRFHGGWWELPDEKQPAPDALLHYLAEVEQRISQHFSLIQDEDLTTPFDQEKEHGETRLEHYCYALRHTMHHHGALSLLSLVYENQRGIWA